MIMQILFFSLKYKSNLNAGKGQWQYRTISAINGCKKHAVGVSLTHNNFVESVMDL